MHSTVRILVTGVAATATMDAAAATLERLFGTKSLDYRLVGRWIGHLPHGGFAHDSIATTAPVPGEAALGHAAHYAIGVGFAALLDRLTHRRPATLPVCLSFGLVTVAAPWLVMQPAFGMGIAASKTPAPRAARLGSLRAHAAYGAGLWLGGKIAFAWSRRRG